MGTVISIILIGIIIICIWSGYKKGIIMGIGGILAIIVSLYGANLLANTFSYEVLPALRPFASGFIEKQINDDEKGVIAGMGWEKGDYSVADLLEQHPGSTRDFAAQCYLTLGIDETSAATMAEQAAARVDETGDSVVDCIVQVLCEKVSFVACFSLAFVLILIVLTVIGNLPNLSYKIPNLDTVNDIGGAVLGLVTGLMFCAIIVWALKFVGMIIGTDTLDGHAVTRLFLNHNFLTNRLGF